MKVYVYCSILYFILNTTPYAEPNDCMLSGAKKGLTVGCDDSSDLHLTTVGGHTGLGQGAGGGHLVAGGHLTTGQRGLGHGGHSPESVLHLLLSMITG